MKNLKFIKQLFAAIALLLWSHWLLATNIRVSDIVIVERNNADKYIIVQFNLSWDYSFRVDDGPNTNWDAAWVFMKFKDINGSGNVQWGHATLASSGHLIPGNYTSSLGASGAVNKGIFVYPSVIFANTASINGMRLRWDYGEDGLEPEDEVDIRVFGIEMVYVPQGNFYAGSGGSEINRFHAVDGGNTTPFQVGSASFQIGNTAGNLWATGEVAAGAFDAGYPTGYNAFYIMKHNITQQAYIDFLNTITYEQQNARINGSPADPAGTFTDNQFRHKIKIKTQGSAGVTPAEYETENPYLPINFFSPNDLLAYLDWAALRPYTELEYEKAARGPASPVPDEYAWGNTRIGNVTSISNAGLATEAPVATGYQRDITIDYTKVNETLTDFPILVRLDIDNFDFSKCRADGFDIRFYDSNGNALKYQRERHNFAAKQAEYWVKVPTLSSTQNTVITMEYGNLSATDGADPLNVWDVDFVSLWHLNETANGTAGEYKDSKGSNNGQGTGTIAGNIEGKIGRAQEFDGGAAISVPNHASLNMEDSVTISGWLKPQTLTGVILSESTNAQWNDNHSISNITVSDDKLSVNAKPGSGSRISKSIALDAIKKVGSSTIDWEDELGYRIEVFTSNGIFSVPAGVTEVDVLVVGGGGGGGRSATPNASGGGGAGGVVFQEGFSVTPGSTISITVGNGGTGGQSAIAATAGGNSIFSTLTAEGGGRGGQNDVGFYDGDAGGSGGGSASTGVNGGAGSQGNAGGAGLSTSGGGAGGGGAGGAGGNPSGNNGAIGGMGVDYSSFFGAIWGDGGWFAGGGGGGASSTADNAGTGGTGGGGNSVLNSGDNANAMANTGGGGGAGNAEIANEQGGNGGSGIVLVRFKDPQSVNIYTAINESTDTPPNFDLNTQVFTTNGTFTVPFGITKVDVLVVGGGGGGSGSVSGGAGAGGLVWQEGYNVTPGESINISVGAGGAGGATNTAGSNGQNSVFGTITAFGGGRGAGSGTVNAAAGNGGSGGGGARYTSNYQPSGGTGTAGQGNNGGNATAGTDTYAGGGGAGGVGQSVASGPGSGGIGRDFSNMFGTGLGENGWFAGGGGSSMTSGAPGSGGLGGGGNGSIGSDNAENGIANTGGGGGGAYSYAGGKGGDGGSGIVIVRWGYATKGDPIPGINTGDDLTGKYLWIKQELTSNNATFSPELNSMNIEIKGEAIIAGKSEDTYQLSYYDGNLKGYINNQDVFSSLTLDQYQHIAVTYNGSFQRIYINGLLTSTRALTGNINTNTNSLLMGTNLGGELDEIRISRSARSQTWLKAEYHSGNGDLVLIGGEGQNVNAVYGSVTFPGIGQGPLRVGFGASPTSSRTSSGASYWGVMELSGNLWERIIPAGRATSRSFTGIHGDGQIAADGTFNVANWPIDLGNKGGQWNNPTIYLRISDRSSVGWNATWADRNNWQGGRGARTTP